MQRVQVSLKRKGSKELYDLLIYKGDFMELALHLLAQSPVYRKVCFRDENKVKEIIGSEKVINEIENLHKENREVSDYKNECNYNDCNNKDNLVKSSIKIEENNNGYPKVKLS